MTAFFTQSSAILLTVYVCTYNTRYKVRKHIFYCNFIDKRSKWSVIGNRFDSNKYNKMKINYAHTENITGSISSSIHISKSIQFFGKFHKTIRQLLYRVCTTTENI